MSPISASFLLLVSLVSAQSTVTVTRNRASSSTATSTSKASTLQTLASSSTAAQQTTFTSQNTSPSASITATPTITAVSKCHMHETVQYCMAGTAEYQVLTTATGTSALPAQYTGCHAHGSEMFCIAPSGDEVELQLEGSEAAESTSTGESAASAAREQDCHYHNGVEHCVGGDEDEGTPNCGKVDREYNISLRVGLLFVILLTSGMAVFGPIFLTSFTKIKADHVAFVVLKQFGTGVIISTAFIHLYTHADLMFTNRCLGELSYESTTSAILIAGLFLSFLVDYLVHRFARSRNSKTVPADPEDERPASQSPYVKKVRPATSTTALLTHKHATPDDERSAALNVLILEAGIVFHSLLIGLTLVVAPDAPNGFLLLFIVIAFHQIFEGIALGVQIASLPTPTSSLFNKKYLMATLFALITPTGMAIGIGVLHHFNGNDKGTLIAIGTLDAFSAGILAWVGIVEMWAADWVFGGLKDAPLLRTCLAMAGLVAGIVLMSVLGKWA